MRALPQTRAFFADSGVRFRHAFATFPLCCPSRATLLTGQYAHNHGVRSNSMPNGSVHRFDDTRTVAVALDAAGYRTAYIGKYLNGYESLARQDPPYEPPGWDRWRASAFPGRMWGWAQVVGDTIREWGTNREPGHYQTDVLARQAGSFIESSLAKSTPFFLTVATLAPHGEKRKIDAPANPRAAPRHRHRFRRARFPRTEAFNEADVSDKPSWVQARPRLDSDTRQRLLTRYRDRLRSLLAVDEMVADLVATLHQGGALDDTVVIFTSDNGIVRGEHRLTGKDVAYDEASRIPLFVSGPGFPTGVRIDAPVANIDIARTVYDATAVDPALEQDGVSLLEIAADPQAYADRDLLIETQASIGVRTSDFLYVEHPLDSGTEYELYDLRAGADPLMLQSVHDDPVYLPERVALAKRLNDLRDCAGASCR